MNIDQEYYRLLEEIQAVDFVLVELTLYLDTHAKDDQALKQFNQYAVFSKQLKTHFEEKYGPLQQFGNSVSENKWYWAKSPWPWQV